MARNTEAKSHYVETEHDVKTWMMAGPCVQTARPPRCVICDAPGVDANGKVILHGHGLRERTLLGPLDAGGEPKATRVVMQRYACQRCKAVLTVGPRGLLPWRRYSAMALALALWWWGVYQLTDPVVREQTSPVEDEGLSRPERWTTLRRWGRAVQEGRLWPRVSIDPSWSLRECAKRAALLLWSRGSPDSSTDEGRVFRGAALAH